ncbi:hypothetical protein KYC5002_08190 [Archangium violaceum]|uniref:hypothetical protein n=1 Tax=Archangium violaceum TaxID=83451 RepID=UPI002B316089|nr:hypothetical protein KYC5002_08190 [Archangium gephyra]
MAPLPYWKQTQQLVYFHENGAWFAKKTDHAITSVCTLDAKGKEMNLLSAQGQVLRWYETGGDKETIDPTDEGPSDLPTIAPQGVVFHDGFTVAMALEDVLPPVRPTATAAAY